MTSNPSPGGSQEPPSFSQQQEHFMLAALQENREAIKEHLRKTLMDGITRQFQWELPEVIKKEVTDFMSSEIVPEIRKQLLEDKELIVQAATVAARDIALEVGKKMQEVVAKNLANSYTMQEIGKKLFGGY